MAHSNNKLETVDLTSTISRHFKEGNLLVNLARKFSSKSPLNMAVSYTTCCLISFFARWRQSSLNTLKQLHFEGGGRSIVKLTNWSIPRKKGYPILNLEARTGKNHISKKLAHMEIYKKQLRNHFHRRYAMYEIHYRRNNWEECQDTR